MRGQRPEDSQGSEMTLSDTVMVHARRTGDKPQNVPHPEEPPWKLNLRAATVSTQRVQMLPVRPGVRDGDSGEAVRVKKWVMWELCAVSAQFCQEPKIALEKKVYLKEKNLLT